MIGYLSNICSHQSATAILRYAATQEFRVISLDMGAKRSRLNYGWPVLEPSVGSLIPGPTCTSEACRRTLD